MTQKRWVVTSTWGQHYLMAEDEQGAEESAENDLREQGYGDPANMILDGLTQEYDSDFHGEWAGEES